MPSSDESSNLHHHFDLHAFFSVPESHAWPNLHDHPTVDPSSPETIPVINLSAVDAASLIGRACEDWGVFQVISHGIPTCLLEKLDSQVRRLFSLSVDRKLKAVRASGSLSGYGLAPLSSFFSKHMWSEGFTVAGSSVDHARKLWPDQDPAQFCDTVEEYNKEVEALAQRLMKMMFSSLNHTKGEFKRSDNITEFKNVSAVLQLNWYPACPDPDRAMGLAAHTDSGLLTVLYQSTFGLQVLCTEGGASRWVEVPPLPGALVVNIGDLGHILSNGRYRSIVHRAVVNRTAPRLSAAYICGPATDIKVSPATGPAKYRAITWPEYRGIKANLFDKALASIRITPQGADNDFFLWCDNDVDKKGVCNEEQGRQGLMTGRRSRIKGHGMKCERQWTCMRTKMSLSHQWQI